ncbi:MAG: 3'-5' exonuclease [Euryarchaeota archaeon]|nr:3'-5' exonuclease [Euryarchaeota archaeon]
MDWVAFDLETTGLPRWSRPVEVGARRFFADGHVEDFSMLVNPGIRVPSEVTRIHGITDAMVHDAPDVVDAFDRFFAFVEGAALVAHNAAFDASILAGNAERLEYPLPALPVYDSVRIARRLLPHLWSYRLVSLVRALGIEHERFHRAHEDAVLVGRLMRRLLQIGSPELADFPSCAFGRLSTLDGFLERPILRRQRIDAVAAP